MLFGLDLRASIRETRVAEQSLAHLELGATVAAGIDEAQRNGAKATWIDLVDHGGGGGGLQTPHGIRGSDDIAGAIADGIALHAKDHPEDGGRGINGVLTNQCQMVR